MYEGYFGLAEKPFSLTPNPRYVFYSDRYRAALDQLTYGIEQKEGFLLLTGPVGTGKTTLCRHLLEQLDPKKYRTALLFNPFLNAVEMLHALLSEFGCSAPPGEASKKELLDRLNRFLLAQLVEGHTCVAIFDEAQHLTPDFLEQIRVLSNLETEHEKLLQIVLVGQPELRQRIQQDSLAQLDQRVSMRLQLTNLSLDETEQYIYHRLNVAGSQGRIRFAKQALKKIYEASTGVPRLINQICDRTLLAGYVDQTLKLGGKQVAQALRALQGEDEPQERPPARLLGLGGLRKRWLGLTLTGLLVLAAAGAGYAWGLL